MSPRISAEEIVRAFGETYRSIDVRTAALREREDWVNTLTVVRLTYEEPGTARERLSRLEKTHGPIRTARFRIVTIAHPFSYWDQFLTDLREGVLRFEGSVIGLRQPITLESLENQLQSYSGDVRPFDSMNWPSLNIFVGPHKGTELSDEALTRQVGALGYPEPYECINSLCEMNVRQGQAYGHDFYLSVPVFISVSDARVIPQDRRLVVMARVHRELHDMRGFVFLRGQHWNSGQPPKARLSIPSFEISKEKPIAMATGSVDLPEVEPTDWVDVRIFHKDIGEVDGYFSRQVNSLIPQAERNILFEALKRFCPDSELEGLLLRPHEKKTKKTTESAAFELHVAWLLGLFGCPTVLLGEYENLVAPETRITRGSVDILAVTPRRRTLLLVACTLGPPKEEDFTNLRNLKGILAEETFAETTIGILPVVFTAARGCPDYRETNGFYELIPIIDAESLDTLLAFLRVGNEERFFEFLGNPSLSSLKKF